MQLIRRGGRGAHVLDVQHRLARLGYPFPTDERGVFGEVTERAVREFQQARGLLVDGIVGAETWRELVEASWNLGDRTLYLRAPSFRGDDVRELQDTIATMGFDVGRIDGIFGPQTDAALREFQKNYGLPPDGVVGEGTVRALQGLPRMAGDRPAATVREREAMRTRTLSITGLRVVVDPGHGGDDQGNVGPGDVAEAAVCFAIAQLVEAELASAGAQVYLTRRAADGPRDEERAALANALDADVFVSIHLASGEEAARGATALYFGHERFRSEGGARLAELLLEELVAIGIAECRAHPKTTTVLRETRMTAVVVEPVTVSDPGEAQRVAEPAFQRRIASAIARGVRRFTQVVAAV